MKTFKVLCDCMFVRKYDTSINYSDKDFFQLSTGEEYEILAFDLREDAYPGYEQQTKILIMQNKKLIWVKFDETMFEII